MSGSNEKRAGPKPGDEGLQPRRGHDAADIVAGPRHYPLAAAVRLYQLPASRKRIGLRRRSLEMTGLPAKPCRRHSGTARQYARRWSTPKGDYHSREDARAYLVAPKRLSNEFDDTIGAEPETRFSLAAGAGASDTDGFSGGRLAAACLVSACLASMCLVSTCLASTCFGAVAFGASARGGSLRFVSAALGFEGGVLAVASAALPRPTLRARLENHPSF